MYMCSRIIEVAYARPVEVTSVLLEDIYMNTHYWPGIGNFNTPGTHIHAHSLLA
jgi:hypothetical protein